jgi:hypothetical protein
MGYSYARRPRARWAAGALSSLGFAVAAGVSLEAAAAEPMVVEPAATVNLDDYGLPGIHSVAVDGDDLAVAAEGSNSHAAVVLFHRNAAGTWQFAQQLLAVDGSRADTRMAIALRGNILAVHYSGESSSTLAIFERTASGWQARPVVTDFAPYAPVYAADVEIDGSTVLLTGGPKAGQPYCDSVTMRAFRKDANGRWVIVDSVSSDPIVGISPPEAACLVLDADGALSGTTAILSAIELAQPEHGTADYIFSGAPGNWSTPIRLDGYKGPVAVENDLALLTGTDIFQKGSNTWILRQTLQRPDRLMLFPPKTYYGPTAAEMRNGLAVTAFLGGISVYELDGNHRFQERARLRAAGKTIPPYDDPGTAPLWYPHTADISGRRVVLGDVYSALVRIFDLPAVLTQPAKVQETFESGASRWTPIAGSNWAIVPIAGSHVYRQSSTAGDAGAFLGNMDWTNQSIQADITPRAFNGNDRWFGLAVRRTDARNYYYLTVRNSNSWQLRKMVNGSFQTLASTGLQVPLDHTYRLRLEAMGKTISVYLDDNLILQSVDDALTHGQAGLVMYKAAADYDNVIVNPTAPLRLFDYSAEQLWTSLFTSAWSTSEGWEVQSSTAGDAGRVTGIRTTDQSIEAFVQPLAFDGTDRWYGLMTRYRDNNNYYYVSLRNSNQISLRKRVNGVTQVLDTAPLAVSTGTGHWVRFEAVQNQLRVYVGGQLMLEATDSALSDGRYGMLMYKAAARYTQITVDQQ